ncbi:hypothetical protein KKE26_00240 [bacterium]|nr:hypothetical protein [bacterium]MBU1753363.1 hypothetical protein [bacterium]
MTESYIQIAWTDYMKYRARLREFDLAKVEHIVRYSGERYVDTVTGRLIITGRIDDVLVMIPCETEPGSITPITIHATTCQQINFRLKTGRFVNE